MIRSRSRKFLDLGSRPRGGESGVWLSAQSTAHGPGNLLRMQSLRPPPQTCMSRFGAVTRPPSGHKREEHWPQRTAVVTSIANDQKSNPFPPCPSPAGLFGDVICDVTVPSDPKAKNKGTVNSA